VPSSVPAGITLVQEPSTAKYDGMPSSAIQAGYATHIATADNMPEILLSGARARGHSPGNGTCPTTVSGMSRILMLLRQYHRP